MANRKLTVRANRTYNGHYVGEPPSLVEETADVKAEIRAGLLTVIAVESDGKEPKPEPAKSKAKAKDGDDDV